MDMLLQNVEDQVFCTALLRTVRRYPQQVQPAIYLYFPNLLKILAW